MSTSPLWLRGPIAGISASLQGVAHGLLETHEELKATVTDLPLDKLWFKPFGVASVGFHLQHVAGATDRLFTYARGEVLTDDQRAALASERKSAMDGGDRTLRQLRAHVEQVIESAVEQLRRTDIATLDEPRYVGGKQLPSTVSGLLEHAAQRASRHGGQVVTTVKVITRMAEIE